MATGEAALGFEEDDSSEGKLLEGTTFVLEYDKSPSVSLERGDDFVPRNVNNKEDSVVLGGVRDASVFSVRCGSVGRHDSEDFNFNVVVSNGADDG